ncbi:FAD-dependent oxidoreductase [Paraburkholderia sp. BR14374]|uniref:FAD-dependent oxidoreductase n=1 Tax=Paraburkholderia sp. BR14374 TaxID=3237007 RepID=UPI0034CEB010
MSDFDVIVLGTGAAALTAAVTAHEGGARVAVFEKRGDVGGTSAWSGGQIWIPNHGLPTPGREDSREKALTYLAALSHGTILPEIAEAFVDAGPEMIDFLGKCSPVTFDCIYNFPDYHSEFPGAMREGGRTLECHIFPFGNLGEWKDKVTVSPYWPDNNITVGETTLGQPVPTEIDPAEKQRRRENDERGMGQALIGRLLRACLDRGIEPQLNSRAIDLVMENGAVAGVKIETAEGVKTVTAPNVVIATGGFEHNKDLVRAFLRGPMTKTVAVPENEGDGLKIAMKVGAMLGNMREAWWIPIMPMPESVNGTGLQLCTWERTFPRSIMVNKKGKRFTNEAANYNAFGAAFHEQDVSAFQYANLPCWLVFDQGYYSNNPFVGGLSDGFEHGMRPPEWIAAGETLAELAEKVGIDAAGLEATVKRWNEQVDALDDTDFQRGNAANDIWWGSPAHRSSRAATMGKLDQGPFYAIPVESGCLGTKGGPQTDVNSNVLDTDGKPIQGLYAAGNAQASPMGMTYGGAGGTLGPAMVFGYLAGKHAGQRKGRA